MTLYEINQSLQDCLIINTETGEVEFNEEEYANLQMLRQDKLESIACWIKNLNAESEAIAKEIKALGERKKSAERKADYLKSLLQSDLAGEKFSTPKVSVSYRKSEQVIVDLDKLMKKFIKYTPAADKTAIKEALKSGVKVRGAYLQEYQNMQIK